MEDDNRTWIIITGRQPGGPRKHGAVKDVAARFGVSCETVRHYLRGGSPTVWRQREVRRYVTKHYLCETLKRPLS